VGVGPGAHGRFSSGDQKTATIAYAKPNEYIDAVTNSESGIETTELMDGESQAAEYLLMGLRTNEGVSVSQFQKLNGEDLPSYPLASLIEGGFLERDGDNFRATLEGRALLDHITMKLLT